MATSAFGLVRRHWSSPQHCHLQHLHTVPIYNKLQTITSRHGASGHAGFILINRFPVPLLFHNHRSLPTPIHGYDLQTPLLYLGFLTLLSPFLPLALTLHPSPSPFVPPLSLSFLGDIDDYAFLDCSHEYHGLQSDAAYFLSAIFCDALLPVNCSECNSSTLVWSEVRILLCLLNDAGYVIQAFCKCWFAVVCCCTDTTRWPASLTDDAICDVIGCHKYNTTAHTPLIC